MGVRHVGDGCQIRDVAGRIADGFNEDGARIVVDVFGQAFGAIVIGKAHVYALFWQHMPEKGPGAAVKLRHGDDIIAGFRQVEDRIVDGSLARAQR